MTQSSNPDQITITPTAAPLSQGARTAVPIELPPVRAIAFGAAVLALGALAAWVFFALPGQIDAPNVQLGKPPIANTAAPGADSGEVVAPYRRVELARAEDKARVSLGKFVELQMLLEDEMNVDVWGSDHYAAVKERANQADQRFLGEKYEEALFEYDAATADLQSLKAEGEALYAAALERGGQALDARRPADAKTAFGEALVIRPGSDEARSGADRAANQPKVLDLVREAERARLRSDLAEAQNYLVQARALDPLTTGIDAALAQIRSKRSANAYQAKLSAGFVALENKEFDAADAAFNDVLATRPNDPVALAGLQQNQQSRTLARIDALSAQARASEDAGDWSGALATFEAALEIDRTLQFARDGRQRVRVRVRIIREIDAYLDDPFVLSEDAVFEEANALLSKARGDTDAGAAYDAKVAEYASVLSRAAIPVELILVSDNATLVTIYKFGALGSFERKALRLRPGRYTIVGSRDGCRDVRKEIVLEPGMGPVAVRCEERI